MSVWKQYTQLFARNWRCGRFVQSLSQVCSEKIRKKDIVMTAGCWSSWSIQIPQLLMLWWPVMKAGSIAVTQRPRDRVPIGSMLALPDPTRPDRRQMHPQTFDDPFFVTALIWYTCTGFPLDRQSTSITILREFRKRFLGKRPVSFKSGQWHFHQDNAPVHNSILVTDYLTKMGINTVPHPLYCPDLAPSDFCLFTKLKEKLRGCHYETIEEKKGGVTKVINTLTHEDFNGAFQKLLEQYNKCIAAVGDYFEGDQSLMCLLSIKVPIRKKSLETYLTILLYDL